MPSVVFLKILKIFTSFIYICFILKRKSNEIHFTPTTYFFVINMQSTT